MSSSSDTAGAKAVVKAAEKKGGQLTSAETASVLSGVNRSSGGGGSSYSPPAQVTDMSQWYRDTQAAQGYKPTADQVSAATQSYKEYVAGKTNPSSGYVWNQYGEIIGNTGTGSGGYTDFSWQGANATVDPNRTWNADARNNPNHQRSLTGVPLTGTYLDYNTNTWGQAPEDYRTGKANSPGFVNYAQLGTMADNWLATNPNSLWDRDSLVNLWQGQYQDLSAIPNMMNQYAHEFANGIVPSNFQYNPNSLYGDARTGATPLYPGATTAGATAATATTTPITPTPAQQAGDYASNPNWVGNIYDNVQWNPDRTITAGDGRVLREGIDFYINPNDNRAYVLTGVRGDMASSLTPTLATTLTTTPTATGLPDVGNEWHNAWREERDRYIDAIPAYNPPTREEFRFLTPPSAISSSGDDIHTPTLAARQQWENEQNALQDQYAKQYGVNYQRAQDIYNTQLDWIKTGMLEQQRQEQVAAEAARYQAEMALKQEQDKYNRSLDLWTSGVGTDEIYRTLGIPAGSKPFEQTMNEWKMKLAEMEYALDVSKAASKGSGGGGGGLYSATLNDMLSGQSRHRQALVSGEKRNPHSYNYYIGQAIELGNKTGRPLSKTEIDALRKQADYLAKTDEDWIKSQIATGRLPQRIPITKKDT